METIRGYLISLVAVCMIAVLASVLLHGSPINKFVRLIGGILVLLVAVSPLLTVNTERLSERLEGICGTYAFDTDSVAEERRSFLSEHIMQTTETYIENKAAELGAAIQAEVTLTNDEYPVPNKVKIIGTLTVEQIESLAAYLTDSLGIAPENQEWKLYGTSE